MADTFANPYNYTSPIGAALADLTRTIISGPSRAEKIAAAENMLKIKRANENLLKAQTIISTPGYDQNAFAAAALGGGVSGSDLGDYGLFTQDPNAAWDDPTLNNAFIRAGGAPTGTAGAFKLGESNENMRAANALGETTRFHDATLAQDESQFGRTFGETQRQFDQKPVATIVNGQPVFTPQSGLFGMGISPVLSETENKALAAQNLFPNLTDLEQRRYIGVDPSMSDFGNVVGPDGVSMIADPAMVQGMVGQPNTMVVGKENAAGSEGLTAKVLGDAQGGLIDIGILDANLGAAEQLVTTMPDTSFGLSGNIQQWAQDAVVLADNLAKGLNMKSASDAISSFQQEAAAAGVDQSIISGMYDPRFPERSSLYMLLGYAAAKALSGGGVLSDQDVKAGLALIGNPDGLFESKQSLLAKINQVRSMNQRKRTVLESAMGGTAAPAAAPVDNIPTVATPEEAAALPPGTQFRTPDGRLKVRP